ncbi:D-alanine--D-alanine ligase [Caenispirillum salinarum AK4]|uniref:D-alanine--D-alanine ligase n=1 Tax=Caenispirillum salinarum AK4 TaxID=1238182 RepID=K9GVJ1_9PROT|nr:D-alanine--D-alanine ligase [Caenispirillum salinarum]EKV29995.1 D-alanine--D-alanine ligase [Caenispirillum salinarum AK4]
MTSPLTRRVTVLMGGFSAEREVSLNSGAAAAKALKDYGYQNVAVIDVPRDVPAFVSALAETKPDVVLNALHGRFGEDGAIQGILDIMGIPYSHSGRLSSAIAMDKPTAKLLFERAGIPVAADRVVTRAEMLAEGDPLPRPYVIKPLNEGSSVGVHIVQEGDNFRPFVEEDWPFGENVMVEAFIPGRELTVAVMGDRPLGVTEIFTDRGFYDYDAKYAAGGSTHQCPADIPPALAEEAMALSVKAHEALGCRGVSRTDLRYDGETLYILEVNTQPGMTGTSLVPEQAAHAGISFPELCHWMVETARCDS